MEDFIDRDEGLAKTTPVMCPQCQNEFEEDRRIDDDFDKDVSCPNCSFRCSGWNFIYWS